MATQKAKLDSYMALELVNVAAKYDVKLASELATASTAFDERLHAQLAVSLTWINAYTESERNVKEYMAT